MQNPFISIVLPTRDRPELVGPVLKHLKEQTFENFEVIISDNGVQRLCDKEVLPYLSDERFKYKRPPYPMAMSDHWEFAVENAQGSYVSVFCEKYILRKDALAVVAAVAAQTDADIINWQRDYFDVTEQQDGLLLGTYHPLMKPDQASRYSAAQQLKERFGYDFPIFSRFTKSSAYYGKIYSGCVKRTLIDDIKKKYGRIFNSHIPDFSSKFAALNECKVAVDVGQSLMLVLAQDGYSNGLTTRKSAPALHRFLSEYSLDFADFCDSLPINGFWIGSNSGVARELMKIKALAAQGPILDMTLDTQALAFWAHQDLLQVEDWGAHDKAFFLSLLAPYLHGQTGQAKARLETLEENRQKLNLPNPNEIYHSGLEKIDHFRPGTSAEELAHLHWQQGLAPPRKNIQASPVTLDEAARFFCDYNLASCELLGLSK